MKLNLFLTGAILVGMTFSGCATKYAFPQEKKDELERNVKEYQTLKREKYLTIDGSHEEIVKRATQWLDTNLVSGGKVTTTLIEETKRDGVANEIKEMEKTFGNIHSMTMIQPQKGPQQQQIGYRLILLYGLEKTNVLISETSIFCSNIYDSCEPNAEQTKATFVHYLKTGEDTLAGTEPFSLKTFKGWKYFWNK